MTVGLESLLSQLKINSTSPLSKDEQLKYLDYITSSPLESLKQEPQLLSEEIDRTQQQLSGLAFSEYQSFLRAFQCSKSIKDDVYQLQTHITSLDTDLVQLQYTVDKLITGAQRYALEREKVGLIVMKQEYIQELLEIPQLCDTFVKQGHYEEALDLAFYCHRITNRYPHLHILNEISAQIQVIKERMLVQLISLLGGSVKLPLAMRVIGFLRRMELFSDTELKIVFLNQRNVYLNFQLDQIQSSDPSEYLKRYIEVSRETFFDILTQYSAIFTDSHSSFSNSDSILSFYATFRVNELLDITQIKLNEIHDASSIQSLLTQMMYYGMSLGRLGLDFRHLISIHFEDALYRIVTSTLQSGTDAFIEKMMSMPIGPWKSFSESDFNNEAQLMSFPCLASLMNVYYTVFNQIRILPMLNKRGQIFNFVSLQVSEAAFILQKLGLETEDHCTEETRMEFENLCQVFVDVFVPHVANGMESLFGIGFDKPCVSLEWVLKWASNGRRRLKQEYIEST